MPVYEYICDECNVKDTRHQGSKEDMQGTMPGCPKCGAPMRRIFNPTPFIFRQGGTGARRSG
jgi:putative FmdB family regulatory protein